MGDTLPDKLFFKIGDVAEIVGVKPHVLRYWETEFTQLQPNKNSAGNRNYRSHDIDIILNIKSLLYDRKFTIKGARQYFNKPTSNTINDELPRKLIKLSKSADVRILKDLKNGLDDLIGLIEEFRDK